MCFCYSDQDELTVEQYLSLKRDYVLRTATEMVVSQLESLVTQQTTTGHHMQAIQVQLHHHQLIGIFHYDIPTDETSS